MNVIQRFLRREKRKGVEHLPPALVAMTRYEVAVMFANEHRAAHHHKIRFWTGAFWLLSALALLDALTGHFITVGFDVALLMFFYWKMEESKRIHHECEKYLTESLDYVQEGDRNVQER